MNLALSLSISGQRVAGPSVPYPGHVVAYDFWDSPGYVLNSGIETINNLGSGGAAYDTTQSTSTQRATLGTGVADFDGVDDNYLFDAFCGILQPSGFLIDTTITVSSLATNRTLISAVPATGNGYFYIEFLTTGRVRVVLRGTDNANIWQHDVGIAGIGGTGYSTGVEYRIRIQTAGGLLQFWNGDTQIVTDAAAAWGGGTMPTFGKAALWARRLNTEAFSQQFAGSVRNFLISQV